MYQNYEDLNMELSPFEMLADYELTPVVKREPETWETGPGRKRPGRPPAQADETLTEVELERRNKRRKRNREAAQRVRDRRVASMQTLQQMVNIFDFLKCFLEIFIFFS